MKENCTYIKYINKEDKEYIQNYGDVLACRYYHKIHPSGVDAIGDCGSDPADGKNWDIFHVHYETKDSYYGIPMLGMGLCDCMILKSDTRLFSEVEKREYNLSISSRNFNVIIEPIADKLIEG